MTYQPAPVEFGRSARGQADKFAGLRSRCIDSFARLETLICKCIIHFECGLDARKVPLSQRLTALAKVKPSPSLSTEKAKRLARLTQSCEQILTIRGSLVHSVMMLGEAEGRPVAMFQNAADAALELPVHLILTQEKFEAIDAEVEQLASQFSAYLPARSARPSSPNPVSADAGL